MYYILILICTTYRSGQEKEILKEKTAGDRVSYARDYISEYAFRHLMNLLWNTDYYEGPAFATIL